MDPAQTAAGASAQSVAPWWHTVAVVFLMVGFSFLGAHTQNVPGIAALGRIGGYVVALIFEWAVVAFICYGIGLRGVPVSDLVGGSWIRPLAVLRDIGIAIGFLVVSEAILAGLQYLLKAAPNSAISNLLPHSPAEIVMYLLLAVTAGFCEELIFRGYLQRQFTVLTRVSSGGIILQGIIFGLSHGYQGWKFMLVIAVFGTMFGLLAQWRGSLRPGMIAHFLQDGVGGLIASYMR